VIGNTDAKGDVDTTYDPGADPITGSHTTTFTAQQPTRELRQYNEYLLGRDNLFCSAYLE